MIARELIEFFATFAGDGDAPRVFAADDPTFLSNVDTAYRRACWEEIRFDDVPYSEDQAFGRALAAHPAWRKAYAPRAGVLHAHDYPPVEFMRRYFDEYRGLRETIGHVERIGARSTVRDVRGLVANDRRWMREQGMPAAAVTRWTGRSVVHHTGRKVFSALGSRGSRLPAPVQSVLSLEGRADGVAPEIAAPPVPDLPATTHQPPRHAAHGYEAIVRVMGTGAAPLLDPVPGMADRERLHVAFAIPPFSVGSGGHSIIFQLVLRLERMGHTCSIWLHDPFNHMHGGGPTLRGTVVEHFAPVQAPVFRGFGDWYGADVAVASGWQTVFPLLEQHGVRARAYLINDHEPEFYPTSVESIWATETYRQGLYGIAGSPWLRDLYIDRYGGAAEAFQYGVDHDVYFPRPVPRRDDTIVFYARSVTPRRAVALGVMALARVKARRPDVRIVLFGDREPLHDLVPVRAHRRRDARAARLGVLGGDGRRVPVADQLLADPPGDARVRPPLRRPGGRERELGVRRRRAGRAGAVRRRRARRRARAAARRSRRARAPLGGGPRLRRGRTPGTRRRCRSSGGCGRRSGCARRDDDGGHPQPGRRRDRVRADARGRGDVRPRHWCRCSRRRSCSRSRGRSSRRRSRRRTSSPTSATSSRSSKVPGCRGRRVARCSPASRRWRRRSPTPIRRPRSRA